MTTLFSDDYSKLVQFVFNLFDFDKDKNISKEDLRIVLSYIPLKEENFQHLFSKYQIHQFKDRIESQNELFNLLEKCFEEDDSMDIREFTYAIENISSDIFLFILIFLLEKKPFSKNFLEEYNNKTSEVTLDSKLCSRSPAVKSKLIASPNFQSKFSPSVTISKSPSISSTHNRINQTSNKLGFGQAPKMNLQDSKNFLLKFAGNPQQNNLNNQKINLPGEGSFTLSVPQKSKKNN